jgi:hypothetical protein
MITSRDQNAWPIWNEKHIICPKYLFFKKYIKQRIACIYLNLVVEKSTLIVFWTKNSIFNPILTQNTLDILINPLITLKYKKLHKNSKSTRNKKSS